MIRSMTAYAREEQKLEIVTLTWEVRSVNHRYLEPFIRLPEELRFMEGDVRDSLKQYLQRGKLEVILTLNSADSGELNQTVNAENLGQLAHLCELVKQGFPELREVSPLEVLKWPGILDTPDVDIEQLARQGMELLRQTLKDLVAAREREGQKLCEALLEKVAAMETIVGQVRGRMVEVLQKVRERLQARFEELQVQVDNDRLEQEMVLITQRSDVEEELKRLETHLSEVRRILTSKETKPVGRRLDFLMQELNREANTLCSKSMDSNTTKAGIDLKVYIEQMREQVQNIE